MRLYKFILFIWVTVTFSNTLFAVAGYSKATHVQVQNKEYIVYHYNDFTYGRQKQIGNVFKCGVNSIFDDSKNTFSYIKLVERNTGEVIFRKPCPAFTDIIISEDSKYIICLSKIKSLNPYNIVVYNITGKVLFKKKIESMPIKLSPNRFQEFISLFPAHFKLLIENNSISKYDSTWYLQPQLRSVSGDSLFKNYFTIDDYSFNDPNVIKYSFNTGWYKNWYDSDSLNLKIDTSLDGRLAKIIFLNKGTTREINIDNEMFTKEYFITNGYLSYEALNYENPALFCDCIETADSVQHSYMNFDKHLEYSISLEDFMKQDYFEFNLFPSHQEYHFELDSYELICSYKLNDEEKVKWFKIKDSRIPQRVKRLVSKHPDIKTFSLHPYVAKVENGEKDVRQIGTTRFYIIR